MEGSQAEDSSGVRMDGYAYPGWPIRPFADFEEDPEDRERRQAHKGKYNSLMQWVDTIIGRNNKRKKGNNSGSKKRAKLQSMDTRSVGYPMAKHVFRTTKRDERI
jgi:transcription initiation factor TFIIIB Brf1 subunit/transcription initiation factor TFIIB